MPDREPILAALRRLMDRDDPAYVLIVHGPEDVAVQAASVRGGLAVEALNPMMVGRPALDGAQVDLLWDLGFHEDDGVAYAQEVQGADAAAEAMKRALVDVYGVADLSQVRLEIFDDAPARIASEESPDPGDGWYQRLHDVPGVDASLVPPADPPAWPEGLAAVPEQSAPGATLYWPSLGGDPEPPTSSSPAEQWYFAQDFKAPLRQVVARLFSALQLPGAPFDYHSVLAYGRPSLTTGAAREEGDWAVEIVDLIAELNTQLIIAHPAILTNEELDADGIRALALLHHQHGRSERASQLARAAIDAGVEGIDLKPLERGIAPGGPKPPSAPALIAFDRPDGKVRWGVAANAADYVTRHEVGEYVSRSLPAGSRFRLAVPVSDPSSLNNVRDELNWDQDLARRLAEAIEAGSGGDASSDDPRERLIALVLGGETGDEQGLLITQLAAARRERKVPAPRRRNPVPELKAVEGDVDVEVVATFDTAFPAAGHVAGVTWLFRHGAAAALQLTDDGCEEPILMPSDMDGFRPKHVLPQPGGDRCAVFGRDDGAIVGPCGHASALRPGDVIAHATTWPGGAAVATTAGRIAGWDWAGNPLFTRDGFDELTDLAVVDDALLYRQRSGAVGMLDATTGNHLPKPRVSDVSAIAAHHGRLLACTGSHQVDVATRHRVDLPEFFHRAEFDAAREFRGWSNGRDKLALLGEDPSDLTVVPFRRSLSGAWQEGVLAVGDQLVLSFGRVLGEYQHGIDIVSITERRHRFELTLAKGAEIRCAWHVGGDAFRVVVGAGGLEIRPRI